MKQAAPIGSYWDGDVLVTIYEAIVPKKRMWMKNDTFYAAQKRVDGDGMFAQFTRKKHRG